MGITLTFSVSEAPEHIRALSLSRPYIQFTTATGRWLILSFIFKIPVLWNVILCNLTLPTFAKNMQPTFSGEKFQSWWTSARPYYITSQTEQSSESPAWVSNLTQFYYAFSMYYQYIEKADCQIMNEWFLFSFHFWALWMQVTEHECKEWGGNGCLAMNKTCKSTS
jgi:hypothetical protein